MLLTQCFFFHHQLRGLRKTAQWYGGRFSRDSLRNRLHKHDIKSLSKPQPVSHQPPDVIPIRPLSHLKRALGFTVGVGTLTFTVAVINDLERHSRRLKSVLINASGLTKANTSRARHILAWWKNLADGDKCAYCLVGVNVAVFLLWKIKKLNNFMWRYFSNSFSSKSLCIPMALSVFSHYSFVHLTLNMYVVLSFTNVTVDKFLGPDQFWALFITAGLVSSFFGIAHKALLRSPVRAVGASGAILGVLGYTCMKVPDARLKIAFIPAVDFSAQAAVIGILLFDLAGLLSRFRMFDHAAHLGGTLFGVFYARIGDDLIWNRYGSIVELAYRQWKR